MYLKWNNLRRWSSYYKSNTYKVLRKTDQENKKQRQHEGKKRILSKEEFVTRMMQDKGLTNA